MAVSDDLELNLGPALSAVDELGAALDARIAESSAGLATGLADAAAAPVEVNIDTAGVEGELVGAIDAAATQPLEVAVDDTLVTGSIDEALAAANATIEVDADTTAADAEIAAVAQDEVVTIDVQADTGDAQSEVDALSESVQGLGDSASGAAGGGGGGGGMGGLTDAAAGFGAAAGLAKGEAAGLGEQASHLGPIGVAAAAGIGSLTAVTGEFFSNAVSAESASKQLTDTFGAQAEAVQRIHVGTLDTDFARLSTTLGTADEKLDASAANLGRIAKSAGLSSEQAVGFSNNVQALAAAAVAANPSLGDVADASDKLARGLARGGRFLVPYQIALTQAEIAQRALADTGKQSADQLTVQEKAIAGAQLAAERYGDTLGGKVASGAQNAEIQQRNLQVVFQETLETLGKPLVVPVFDVLKAALPIAIQVATGFGVLASQLVPIATTILTAVQPAIAALIQAVLQLTTALGPTLQQEGQSFADLLASFGPVIQTLLPLVPLLAALLKGLAFPIIGLNEALSKATPLLLGLAGALGPLALLLSHFQSTQTDSANAAAEFNTQVFGQAATIADTSTKLKDLNKNATTYLLTQSKFAQTGMTGALLAVGQSVDLLNTELNAGTKGVEEFVAAGIEAGQIKIQIDGVDATADQVRGLNGQLGDLFKSGQAQISQGKQLVDTFAAENQQRDLASKTQLEILVASGQITQAQSDEAVARATNTAGLVSYVQALTIATTTQDTANAASASATDQLEARAQAQQQVNQGLADLAAQALGAGVSDDDLKQKATELGVTYDKLKGFVDGVTQAYSQFKDTLVAGLPSIQDTLNKVGDAFTQGTNPQKLIDQLNASTEALVEFQANVQFLISNNFTALATIAAQKGPEFTNTLVQSIKVGRAGLGAELNNNVQVYVDNLAKTKAFLVNEAAPQLFDANTVVGQEATKAFGQSLDYQGAIQLGFQPAAAAIPQAGAPVVTASGGVGTSATTAFGQGLVPADSVNAQFAVAQQNITALGLTGAPIMSAAGIAGGNIGIAFVQGMAITMSAGAEGNAPVAVAARKLIDDADAIMRDEAGIHSPSTVTAAIGQQWAAGFAQGIDAGTPQVLSAQEQQINAALDAMGKGVTQFGHELFLTLDQAIATFGRNRILANGDIIGAEAVVSGTAAAERAINHNLDVLADYTNGLHAATDAAAGLASATAGLPALNALTTPAGFGSARGPNDGLFAAVRPVGQQVNGKSVSIGTLSVTVPPGTTDPHAFGAAVGKGIMDNLPVEAFIS